ncbi:hypothetical protein ZWY2020_025312 [Hordeum vulgare]|nr:hypothetical protein ZWY2020_025312 [Hordeum vulgare]
MLAKAAEADGSTGHACLLRAQRRHARARRASSLRPSTASIGGSAQPRPASGHRSTGSLLPRPRQRSASRRRPAPDPTKASSPTCQSLPLLHLAAS